MEKNKVRGEPIVRSKIFLNAQNTKTRARNKKQKLHGRRMTWDRFYTPQNIFIIKSKCRLGYTNKQIADFIGITESTVYEWKKNHPEFSEALDCGKEFADAKVEDSLYQRALGIKETIKKCYPHKHVTYNKEGKRISDETVYEPVEEEVYYPPDTKAAIFWLTNRKSDDWKNKQQTELSGKIQVDADVDLSDRLSRARGVGSECRDSTQDDGHTGPAIT